MANKLRPRSQENADPSETTEEQPKPKASPEQLKKLFGECEKADSIISKAETTLAEAKLAKSASVKAIYEANGAGPYRYKGKVLRVVAPKDKEGTYFFRTESADVQDIG